jgi:peptidoglycan/xylan/chitin deacetylase (PgdA/CDA1 family)
MLSKALSWFGDDVKQDNATFDSLFLKASQLQVDELVGLLDHIQALDDDFMTWDELRELMSNERVDFASHTMSHPQLKFTSGDWLDWEFNRSREILIQNLGIEVNSLVVPYGHPRHLTGNVKSALTEAGYSYMFFTKNGVVGPRSKPFLLPRLPLEDEPWRLHIHSCPTVSSLIYSD